MNADTKEYFREKIVNIIVLLRLIVENMDRFYDEILRPMILHFIETSDPENLSEDPCQLSRAIDWFESLARIPIEMSSDSKLDRSEYDSALEEFSKITNELRNQIKRYLQPRKMSKGIASIVSGHTNELKSQMSKLMKLIEDSKCKDTHSQRGLEENSSLQDDYQESSDSELESQTAGSRENLLERKKEALSKADKIAEQCNALAEKIDGLIVTQNCMKRELEAQMAKNEELEAQSAKFEAQSAKFEAQSAKFEAQSAKFEKDLQIQSGEFERKYNMQSAKFEKELEIQRTNHKASQRRIANLEGEVKNLRVHLKTQRAKSTRLSKQLKKEKSENQSLRRKVSDLEEILKLNSHEFDTFRKVLDQKILIRDSISRILEFLIEAFTSSDRVKEGKTNSWDILKEYFDQNEALRAGFDRFLGELSLDIQEFEILVGIKQKLNKVFHTTAPVTDLISMDMSDTGLYHNEIRCLKKFASVYQGLKPNKKDSKVIKV